jgi:ABC-2 type transport system ATP-binding protein
MIKVEHLSKRYAALTAVDDVSFEVAPGEVLGFLGPNGAGKTTTMRMLAGFISPTAGTASRRIRWKRRSRSATCPRARRSTAR